MYFKFSLRNNPVTGQMQGYYRLVESYRNEYGRICHRTLLNIGFLDVRVEQLNAVKQVLTDRYERNISLFEDDDPEVVSPQPITYSK